MSERHHLRIYDREQAVEWLEARQSITSVAGRMAVSKIVILRIKKATELGNAMRKHAVVVPPASFPMTFPHSVFSHSNPTIQKDRCISLMVERKTSPSSTDSCGPCNSYGCKCISQNHF